WSEVPRWVRPALRRALAPVPAQRWDTAAAFQQALEPVEEPSPQWPRPFLVLVAAALIWGLARGLHPAPSLPGLVPAQLAVLPLVAGDGTEGDSLGMDLAYLIHRNLDNLPGLPLTSFRQVLFWLERRGSEIIGEEKFRAARELRVHWVAHGAINRRRDSLLVDLTL